MPIKLLSHLVLMLLLVGACSPKDKIITINGEIPADKLGKTLEHEHILVDFYRPKNNLPEAYCQDTALNVVLPYLNELKAYGVTSFVDCTPAYMGRNVRLLKKIADATGLQIITNTGFYGGHNNRFIPECIQSMTATMISTFWIAEFEQGIDGTAIRPGFIKIAVNRQPLSDFHATLIRAAAITHKETGLTILSHTGPAVAAFQQLAVLKEEGVKPNAFIWAHASDEKDWSQLVRAAKMGAWVSLDKYGWKEEYQEIYPKILALMKQKGVLNKVLLSQDAGWFEPGQPEQLFRPYSRIFSELVPILKEQGVSNEDLNLLFVENPAKAFAVKKRLYQEPI